MPSSPKICVIPTLRPSKPPEVLAHQAREILAKIGYPEKPADSVGKFGYNNWFLSYVIKTAGQSANWKRILLQRPLMLEFWYRQSSREMVPIGWRSVLLTPGVVSALDPPPIEPGMVTMWMDSEGHLQWLQVIPPEVEPDALSILAPQGQGSSHRHQAEQDNG